jgi:hypothetical protein
MAYVQERLGKQLSTCNAFVPRAREDPPKKSMDSDARQHNQEVVSGRMMSVFICSHDDLAAFPLLIPILLPDHPMENKPCHHLPDEPKPLIGGCCDLDSLSVSPRSAARSMAHPEDVHQRPHQVAINAKMMNTSRCSPEVFMAAPVLTLERGYGIVSQTNEAPLTPVPVGPFPVYFPPPSSPKLEFWLRWKPPDNGGHLMQHTYRAVNDTPQPSAIKRSPPNGMHPISLLTDPTHEERPRRLNKELVA